MWNVPQHSFRDEFWLLISPISYSLYKWKITRWNMYTTCYMTRVHYYSVKSLPFSIICWIVQYWGYNPGSVVGWIWPCCPNNHLHLWFHSQLGVFICTDYGQISCSFICKSQDTFNISKQNSACTYWLLITNIKVIYFSKKLAILCTVLFVISTQTRKSCNKIHSNLNLDINVCNKYM